MPGRLDPLPRALTVAWLPMKASVSLSRRAIPTAPPTPAPIGSDREAARDQVGDGVVGGVDQDVAARVGLRTVRVRRRAIADIRPGRIVHTDV